jgi:hypothetical protein
MRNWDSREVRVRVNLPFLIRQVLLPIRRVNTPIRGLLITIRQAVPLTSHIRSYPLYRSHLHPYLLFSTIIAEDKVKLSLSISPCHDHELTLSTAYTEYNIHRVQHPPKIGCLPFILTITSSPLNVISASGVPPYKIDRHQPAPLESLKVKSPRHIPTVAS